jgi:hypothetical protein
MHYRYFLFLFFALLCVAGAKGQNLYSPLLFSHGKIPAEFINSPESRANKRIESEKAAGRTLIQPEYIFIRQTESVFSSLVWTGRITFGDSISNLSNRILNKVVKQNNLPENYFIVYLLRSTKPVCYGFENGIILISTGLFSRLENEAQLAFLLTREVVQIQNRFARKDYIKRFAQRKKVTNDIEEIFILSEHSHKLSDSIAFRFTKTAGYSERESIFALNKYTNYKNVFSDTLFDVCYFEHSKFKLDQKFIPKNHSSNNNLQDNKLQVSLDSRLNTLSLITEQGGLTYQLIDEANFITLLLLAREEVVMLYMEEQQFAEAIYGAYVLSKADTTNEFCNKAISNSFYLMSRICSKTEFNKNPKILVANYHPYFDYSNPEDQSFLIPEAHNSSGQAYNVSLFLNSLNTTEITIIAFYLNQKQLDKSPENKELLDRQKYLTHLLKAEYQIDQHFFVTIETPEDLTTTVTQTVQNEIKPPVSNTDKLLNFEFNMRNPSKGNNKIEAPKDGKLNSNPNTTATSTATMIDISYMLLSQQNYNSKQQNKNVKKRSKLHSNTKYIQRRTNKIGKPHPCFQFIFLKYISDSLLTEIFIQKTDTLSDTLGSLETIISQNNKIRASKLGLGQNHVIIADVNGVFLSEINRTLELRYVDKKSNRITQKQQQALLLSISQKNIAPTLLFPTLFNESETERYNNFCLFKAWEREFENNQKSGQMLSSVTRNGLAESITESTNSNLVMYSYAITKHHKRIRQPGLYTLAIIFPVTTFPAIIYGIIPRNHSRMNTIVYNLNTNQTEMVFHDDCNSKLARQFILYHYQNVFSKLKQPRHQ